jgi:Sigma-54 interaction domain
MAQLLKLATDVDPSPAQRAFVPRSNEQRYGAESATRDQDLARLASVNLLVLGADDVLAQRIASLLPYLVTPILVRHRGESLRLPPTSLAAGTLLVYDVATLTFQEQHALNQWLSARTGRARVVSTASESLLPMVEAGAFNDGLYYRLNVVTIDLRSSVAPQQGRSLQPIAM